MNREQVLDMAMDAGMDFETDRLKDALVCFAALVAAAERERAAEIVDDNAACCDGVVRVILESNAAAIRALP